MNKNENEISPRAPAGTVRSVKSTQDHSPADAAENSGMPREIGGRKGPEPVRYGDWEKDGRCIDF
jgi:hypothetical protein